jgi:uncharacterized protein (TIGR02996 family)
MNEAMLREAIKASPFEVGPRLALADWLEEQGEGKKADKVRYDCRFRMPVSRKELLPLAAIAAARREASGDIVDVAAMSRWYRPGELSYLGRDAIARNFPRDDKGRLRIRCDVVLLAYGTPAASPRFGEMCMIARGPARLSDPQQIRVLEEPLVIENQHHVWTRDRWLWDRGAAGVGEHERWGVTAAELGRVTGAGRSGVVAKLEAQARAGSLTAAGRAMLATAYQDDGRFEEALRLCGVEFPAEVTELLDAGRPRLLRRGLRMSADKWEEGSARMRRTMWQMAPWRLAVTAERMQAHWDAWSAARPGRGLKSAPLRIFMFTGHTTARRPGLMLTLVPDGVRLSIEYTGSNVTAPETWWRRPVELDIARWAGKPPT